MLFDLGSCKGLSPATAELSRSSHSLSEYYVAVLLPRRSVATTPVWALPRTLATTWGNIKLFSLPPGIKMFQYPGFASLHLTRDIRPSYGWVVPFGNLGIKCYLHLPRAYRSLSRPRRLREPRHPPCALSYFLRLAHSNS